MFSNSIPHFWKTTVRVDATLLLKQCATWPCESDAQVWFRRSTARDFVAPKLPWLLEATGSAILDFSIVCQVLYFRRKNRDQPTAAALLPGTVTALL